jgi:hypothetical protein
MQARELDIIVRRVTKATVYYELKTGGRSEEWRVPNESTFDLSQLEIDQRYRVWTKLIWSEVYDYRKGHRVRKEQYDWVSVQPLMQRTRSTTMSAKQSNAAKQAASMPLADNGDLFCWNPR